MVVEEEVEEEGEEPVEDAVEYNHRVQCQVILQIPFLLQTMEEPPSPPRPAFPASKIIKI